jgi:hypothetical protein
MRLYTRRRFSLHYLGMITEIVHRAHRAAHPDQYPVRDETREMYPIFKHIGSDIQPTSVHLQVYDGIVIISSVSLRLTPRRTPLVRCSSRPPNPLPVFNTRKILLPSDRAIFQACYRHRARLAQSYCATTTRDYFDLLPHVACKFRGAEVPNSPSQVVHIRNPACYDQPKTPFTVSLAGRR